MLYQLGWTTLPGLRGLSVSEFRAAPTSNPDNEKGIAVAFETQAACEAFLRQMEGEFAPRRFNNAADAFDTVKAYVLERVAKGI
jgi:2-methylcitrate dehydratase PrpD